MKFAYSANAYRRWTASQAAERVANAGYQGIELMADKPHLWPAQVAQAEIDELRSALDRHGLEIANINAFMMTAIEDFWHPSWIEPDEDYRRMRVQHTIDSLRLASKIGAPNITTEPGGPLPEGISRDQAMDTFVDGLNDALRVAEELHILLLVEPEPDLLIETADQFLELADRIDSPMFGLNFDIGHFYCVSDPLPETIMRLKHLTRHYHFEDIAATRVHEHLIPGHGAIDFSAVLGAIRQTQYDDWITVELYPYLDDPDAAGREALAYLQARL